MASLWVGAASAPDVPLALLQVAETREKQSVLATEIIKGVLVPQFAILPLAVLLIWLALVRGIKPLSVVEARDPRAQARRPEPARRILGAAGSRAAGAVGQRAAEQAQRLDRARRSASWPTPRTS